MLRRTLLGFIVVVVISGCITAKKQTLPLLMGMLLEHRPDTTLSEHDRMNLLEKCDRVVIVGRVPNMFCWSEKPDIFIDFHPERSLP